MDKLRKLIPLPKPRAKAANTDDQRKSPGTNKNEIYHPKPFSLAVVRDETQLDYSLALRGSVWRLEEEKSNDN